MDQFNDFLDTHPGVAAIVDHLVAHCEGEDAKPEEIYVDARMLSRGLTLDMFTNQDYLVRVRRLQIKALDKEDWVKIKGITIPLPRVEEDVEAETLIVAPIDGANIVVGINDEVAGPQEDGSIVFPDRVEHDDRLMAWLGTVAIEGYKGRIDAAKQRECVCGGEGLLASELATLTSAQSDEVGVCPIRYESVRLDGQCLCCMRHHFFTSLFADYWQFEPKVREILWAMEEREAVVAHRIPLDPRVSLAYHSSNKVKQRMMESYVAELAPKSSLYVEGLTGREIQGTFMEIVQDKAVQAEKENQWAAGILVDDAGYMDETGFPGVYAKMIYPKRPAVIGSQKCVVVMTLSEPDEDTWRKYTSGVGIQSFEGGPSVAGNALEMARYESDNRGRDHHNDWRDVVYPTGLLGGPLIEQPSLIRHWNCARFRALRQIFRQRGWIF